MAPRVLPCDGAGARARCECGYARCAHSARTVYARTACARCMHSARAVRAQCPHSARAACADIARTRSARAGCAQGAHGVPTVHPQRPRSVPAARPQCPHSAPTVCPRRARMASQLQPAGRPEISRERGEEATAAGADALPGAVREADARAPRPAAHQQLAQRASAAVGARLAPPPPPPSLREPASQRRGPGASPATHGYRRAARSPSSVSGPRVRLCPDRFPGRARGTRRAHALARLRGAAGASAITPAPFLSGRAAAAGRNLFKRTPLAPPLCGLAGALLRPALLGLSLRRRRGLLRGARLRRGAHRQGAEPPQLLRGDPRGAAGGGARRARLAAAAPASEGQRRAGPGLRRSEGGRPHPASAAPVAPPPGRFRPVVHWRFGRRSCPAPRGRPVAAPVRRGAK